MTVRSALTRLRGAAGGGDQASITAVLGHGIAWRTRRARNVVRRVGRKLAPGRLLPGATTPTPAPALRVSAELTLASAIAQAQRFGVEAVGPDRPAPEPEPPTIAVIVPTYGDSRFLAEALASVQAQTYERWRCYVVDDASPEPVWPVVAPFAAQDRRFVYLRHAANAGLAAARNTGIRHADAELLLFLDADDMLAPQAFEHHVESWRDTADDPTVAGTHGAVTQCPEETGLDDVSTWSRRAGRQRVDWFSSEGESPFIVHSVVVRRNVVTAVGGFDESLVNGAEDWEFWQRILRHGYAFEPCPWVVGAYRQHRTSMIRSHSGVHLRRAAKLLDQASSWVAVDEAGAATPATMPIAEARRAVQRLVRAARWAGLLAAQLGSIDDVLSDEIVSFVATEPAIRTQRPAIVASARAGLYRGLGLGSSFSSTMPEALTVHVDPVAEEIADRLLAAAVQEPRPPAGATVIDLRHRHDPDLAVVAETAADVAALVPILGAAQEAGRTVAAIDVDSVKGDEGSTRAWRAQDVPVIPFNAVALGRARPTIVLATQPAGPVTADLLATLRAAGSSAYVLGGTSGRTPLDAAVSVDVDCVPVDSVPDLLDRVTPNPVDRTAARVTPYSARLRDEESELDALGAQRLLALRDRHRGEVAVVIGNGPSLNATDLGLLDSHVTFGVNAIFLAQDRLPAPITYYVVEDTAVFDDNAEAIKSFRCGTRLFPEIYRKRFAESEVDESTIFFRMNQGFYGMGGSRTVAHPRFSFDASQRLYCGQSVTMINLQLAYWMGFSRVVLIGMDFSYDVPSSSVIEGNHILSTGADPNHFHPDYFGAGKTWKDPKLDRVLANYALAKDIYEADGREIVNATVGGKLELFRRMDLADALTLPTAR